MLLIELLLHLSIHVPQLLLLTTDERARGLQLIHLKGIEALKHIVSFLLTGPWEWLKLTDCAPN